jgi:hypothetical protein
MLLMLLKYVTPNRQHIYLVIYIYFSFWATLIIDLKIVIRQTLLTFNNAIKLVELL